MTDLTYFAQQSCAFTLQLQFRDEAKSGDRVILKRSCAHCSVHELQRPTSPLSPSAPGSTTILVSPRERQAGLLLLFTGYSITVTTSGRLIFLETHFPQSPCLLTCQVFIK